MYDYSASAYTGTNSGIFDSMLYTTQVSGAIPATVSSIITGSETVPGTYYAPYVKAGVNYGATFAYNAATSVTTPAADTTLVSSPISSACYACHDSKTAKSHMILNGGSVYEARSTALDKKETCIVCHGPLSTTNITNVTTPAIKAVHRWW
jgi:cytochrome c553